MEKRFRVGAASTGPADDGLGRALDAAEPRVLALVEAGCDLVILPELFAVPYAAAKEPEAWRHLAEPLDGPTAAWAVGLAKRTGVPILFGMALSVALLPERGRHAKPFNAAVLARPGHAAAEVVALKIHLPPVADGDRFGEADHFEAGPATVGVVEIGPIRLAALVCYDRRFPESWRAVAAAGADAVAVLVSGPAPSDPDGIFEAEMRTHARANAVYAIAAARYGTETITGGPVRHDGSTVAISPDGAIASGPSGPTGGVTVDIDPNQIRIAAARNPTARRLRLPAVPIHEQ
ncbi:nitrilase [Skermanella stibiiresistens SB22]|uniref:Nitrilase n=1 Tax=Skermanella stibiiresistens SB22 TaxID=1385369 RepID=W9GUU8_9PROT|nr:carbon-nitrogen hydrolase family protein [Skermanella stibiiresistens]EWY37584.1 nitrilase [Skermanella stibiiresistens SB22]